MITKSTTQATAYIPLIARASARELCPDSGFVDDYAEAALRKLGVGARVADYHRDMMRGSVLRAQSFDNLCLRYIDEVEADVVVEVGAGFETRPQRLQTRLPRKVEFVHVDLPEVVAYRRSHGLDEGVQLLAADASAAGWVNEVPGLENRRCVLLSEGLTYHLSTYQVRSLLEIASQRFAPQSVLIHDFMSPLMRRFHPGRNEVKGGFRAAYRSGADLYSGVDGVTHLFDQWHLESVSKIVEVTGHLLRHIPIRRWRTGMYGIAVGEVRR